MVTADGVVALNLKATGAKVNGSTVDVDVKEDEEKISALKGNVVKFSKNAAGNITTIAAVKTDDNITGGAVDAEAEFDADDNRFIGKFYIDANS